jgi:hypothetical protein
MTGSICPLPLVVEVAELAILVALGIRRLVFLPQEHQGDGLAAQFPVDGDEVQWLAGLVGHDGGWRKQALLQRLVVGLGGKGPVETGAGKASEVLGDGASGDGAALGDLAFGESTVELQAQHFTDLSHG